VQWFDDIKAASANYPENIEVIDLNYFRLSLSLTDPESKHGQVGMKTTCWLVSL